MSENQICIGYATVWNTPYTSPLGTRFFRRSDCGPALLNPRCRCLVDHDAAQEVGNIGNGGLLLSADDFGLLAIISCPFDERGRDVFNRVCHGELSSMSLWEETDEREIFGGCNGRRANAIHVDRLNEVSLVDRGRNQATAAIAVCDWRRHYNASLSVDVRGDMETLRRLADRNWSQPLDVTLAQTAGRRLAIHRLARIGRHNANPARPAPLLCRDRSEVEIDLDCPELRNAGARLAAGCAIYG